MLVENNGKIDSLFTYVVFGGPWKKTFLISKHDCFKQKVFNSIDCGWLIAGANHKYLFKLFISSNLDRETIYTT